MRLAVTWGGVALLATAAAGQAGAGEILLANGSRLDGELANEVLVVSTGSGLLEVAPRQVVLLTRHEVRLDDGRVIRGTLVGSQVTARTSLGQISIRLDELQTFQTTATAFPADSRGPAASVPPAEAPLAMLVPVSTSPGVGGPVHGRRLEVLAVESPLYRDAFATAGQVGRAFRGELVTYVDFIDRRLRMLNRLVFDGGHWIKVRLADGTEGWLPAETVGEVR